VRPVRAPRRCALAAALALIAALAAASSNATPTDALNAMRAVRLSGCGARPGVRAPLRLNASLEGAAASWSRGVALTRAIERSGYRQDQSAGLHLGGTGQAIGVALAQHLCAALTDPSVLDVGLFQRGSDTWIVLAGPFAAPAAAAADSIALQVLQLVNAARAEAHRCGRNLLPAAPPLRLNAMLNAAALAHAQDMLRYRYFEHTGKDGSSPAQRITATGYRYRIVGENIASGPQTAQEAVHGWLSSPGHCQNLMDARFAELGVAYAASRSGEPRIYWVQEFAVAR